MDQQAGQFKFQSQQAGPKTQQWQRRYLTNIWWLHISTSSTALLAAILVAKEKMAKLQNTALLAAIPV